MPTKKKFLPKRKKTIKKKSLTKKKMGGMWRRAREASVAAEVPHVQEAIPMDADIEQMKRRLSDLENWIRSLSNSLAGVVKYLQDEQQRIQSTSANINTAG